MINKFNLNSIIFKQLYSFLTLALYGYFFFAEYINDKLNPFYLPIAFVMIWQALFIIFTILLSNKFAKLISIFLFMFNALAFYFMYAYNISVDKIMIMNILQTDYAEASALFNFKILYFTILLGVIPSLLIASIKINRCKFKQILRSILISIMITTAICGISYRSADAFLHRFKYLQGYLPPINYIAGISEVLVKLLTPHPPLQKITQDISPVQVNQKPNLIIFVLGETSRAANFSLNGYHRPTNAPLIPYLDELIYFPDVKTCGTSTAVSVPCLFSAQNRQNYIIGSEVYTENVLDIFKKAGYKILWIDNDGGCKNVCNRVYYEQPCDRKTCLDDILLNNLKTKIAKNQGNQLIVLHTRGSHGPMYHKQYDETSNIYQPICTKNELWNCTNEELINVYDNTIIYVSKFLAKTIDILKSLQHTHNTAMFYTADHGESLGENNIYLHSAEYDTAPSYQTEVPMIVWLPQNNSYNLQHSCLQNKTSEKHSHDNVFHSLLGLGGIPSQYYQPSLDIFANCNKQ